MKRFLKQKIDSELSPQNGSHESSSRSDAEKPTIQPPLPVDPPPPGSPQLADITLSPKKEIEEPLETEEDMASQGIYEEENTHSTHLSIPNSEKTPNKDEFCRDFLRSNCNRVKCRFIHKFDARFIGVLFDFCHNYQNRGCDLPYCTFLHCSIFEAQEFKRSGYLPEQSFSHFKKNTTPAVTAPAIPATPPKFNIVNTHALLLNEIEKNLFLQPPPPPPPEIKEPSISVKSVQRLNNAPLPSPIGTNNVNQMPSMEVSQQAIADIFTSCSSENINRSWTDPDKTMVASPCWAEANQKCANCEIEDQRLQFAKQKYEDLLKGALEVSEKIHKVNVKNARLTELMQSLLKNANRQGQTPQEEVGRHLIAMLQSESQEDTDMITLVTEQLRFLVEAQCDDAKGSSSTAAYPWPRT